ncbi:MAG: GNAT family N-acetyltransferase [Bacteroidales bacterium]|nr:GNAT family N-acetyltransferase [Bacteroidales bacterium]
MDNLMIEVAQRGDVPVLCDMFLGHISANSEYISHGEIQMGVGVGRFVDGEFVTSVAPAAREQWLKYINGKIDSVDAAVVFKAVFQGVIVGFCVVEITDDGAEPFGMVCDVLVNGECRKSGIGSLLLERALGWLREKGVKDVYLESGLHNHSAHEYFMRKGFMKVSEIYKLM